MQQTTKMLELLNQILLQKQVNQKCCLKNDNESKQRISLLFEILFKEKLHSIISILNCNKLKMKLTYFIF